MFIIKAVVIASIALLFASCVQSNSSKQQTTVESSRTIGKDSVANTQAPANQSAPYIDTRLRDYLNSVFPGWTVPAPNRWDTLWFNQYKKGSNLVNYVVGDFDCNAQKDYALLFQRADSLLVAYAFLSTGNSFEHYQLVEFGKDTDSLITMGLELMPPGKYAYMDPESPDAPTANIKCNAVQVLYFEKGAYTFYWDKGQIKSILTGD